MIELKDGRYVKAFWTFPFDADAAWSDGMPIPKAPGNLLGALYTDDSERQDWEMVYRFRYYADDKLDSTSKDEKNWYGYSVRASEKEAWQKARAAFSSFAAAAAVELHVALVETDELEAQVAGLSELPGIQTYSAEEWKGTP